MIEQQEASETLRPFLEQLREALTAVANGDPEPMKALCSHTDAVSQCGFWGGVESGWAEVGERWEWVAAQFVPGQGEVTSETAFLSVSGDMAYGVFIERWWGQLRSRSEPAELMMRATLIFRREGGDVEGRPPARGLRRGEGPAKLTPSRLYSPDLVERVWKRERAGSMTHAPEHGKVPFDRSMRRLVGCLGRHLPPPIRRGSDNRP